MKVLVALLAAGSLHASSVDLRAGPAYAGLIYPTEDCSLKDQTIKAIRIETAILNHDGSEIRRATITSCRKAGDAVVRWTYSLDPDGRLWQKVKDCSHSEDHGRDFKEVKRTWTPADGNEPAAKDVQHFRVLYDSSGRLLETREQHAEGGGLILRSTYDARGDDVTLTSLAIDGEVNSITHSRFDDRHHRLSESTDSGPIDHRYRYDPQGYLVEEIVGNGQDQTTTIYQHDERGRPLSKVTTSAAQPKSPWWEGHSYWPNGYLKEQRSIDDRGLATEFESYAYDNHGKLAKSWIYRTDLSNRPKNFAVAVDGHIQHFTETNGLRLFTYTYDSHGNWTKAVETDLADPTNPNSKRIVTDVLYRQIVYRKHAPA